MTFHEFDKWLVDQAKSMPRAMNDRSAQAEAKGAQATAGQQAGMYGQQAQSVVSPLTGFAEGMMTAPPGFGSDLSGMEAQAAQAGTSAAANAQQANALQATRSRNAGSLNASQDAAAQQASQGVGENVQNILNANALLKQQQQTQGAGILQGIYGTDVNAQLGQAGQQANDINAQVNAGKSGWLQNLTGTIGALGQLGSGVGAARGAFK